MNKSIRKVLKKKPRKNIWSISGLENRCRELIKDGALIRADGLANLCATINSEFAEQLVSSKQKFPEKTLSVRRIRELIWTDSIKKALWNAHRNGIVDYFVKTYSYIPESLIKKEIQKLKGVTHSKSAAEFKAGMGVFNDDELPPDAGKFEFPDITFRNPYPVSDATEGCFYVVNGALVGIKYPEIEKNTLRRALAHARRSGAAAVVLTNLIDIWTKKTAGFLAVYRAMVSGLQINPDRFPVDYQDEVRGILAGSMTDETIYQTLNERFFEVLDGLHKITHRINGAPEFNGQVLIQLGLKEEEVIFAGAYYRLRQMSIKKQNKVEAQLNIASSRLEEAKDAGHDTDIIYWSAEVARLAEYKARVIFTNHTGPEYIKYARRMRALVVRKLEQTVKHSKVISQGSSYLKASEFLIKTKIPRHDEVTDGHLKSAGDIYGADVFNDTLADLTIVCPPYSLNFRDVGREDSKNGWPITKYLMVAPSCLDGTFLREEFKDMQREVHPVQQLVNNPTFKPGVLVVSWGNGIISADSLPIEMLDTVKTRKKNNVPINFAFLNPKTKYITGFLNTDNHFGAADKRWIWDPRDQVHLGVTEAAMEMMRRLEVVTSNDIRIHFTAEMDDATQGDLWFKQRYRPDTKLVSTFHFERWLRQMTSDIQRASEKRDTKLVDELASEINRISIMQLHMRGEDFPFAQMMQVFDRHLDPQVDIYSTILESFVKSNLSITGVSKLDHSVMTDTRDLAIINFPEGNHRIGTLEQADLEGDYMALRLQDKIAALPSWRRYLTKNPDFLKNAISAPRFGNATFGWGLIQSSGGFPWGLRVHGTPARQQGWSDILGAVINNDLARGDDSYCLGKYVNVTLYGDKHFYARAETPRMNYIMSAAGVHTNLYGSTGGFPPNNTGVSFVSLPADGPEAGPIIIRRLPHDFLRDWFANPKPFDWNKFLPEPI